MNRNPQERRPSGRREVKPPGHVRMSLLACLLFTAVSGLHGADIRVELPEKRVVEFKSAGVRFNSRFSQARMNECTQTGDNEFRIVIRAENFPINNSAWYAFQVASEQPKRITVRLAYERGRHRYDPKVSRDGTNWVALAGSLWRFDAESQEALLQLHTGPEPLWVAGQELIGVREIQEWLAEMARHDFATTHVFGRSMQDRELVSLELNARAPSRYVLIISRQHPPEVTGTVALMAFVETLAGDTGLARRYRREFRTVVMPMLNPDGAEHGHWRHNLGGVDLNRDWITFKQPESTAARDELLRLIRADGARPYVLLDFHSTHRDVFYTQKDEHPTFPPDFTARWLDAIRARFPDYAVKRDPSHNPEGGTSKSWGYRELGIPAITYELGDETPRELIRQVAVGAAEEMMKLLLEAALKVN